MRDVRRWRRLAAILASLALVATACGGDDDGEDTATEDTAAADTATEDTAAAGTEGGDAAAAGDITTDVGVTEQPCPDALDDSKGCIYLGLLSDLTEGPFAAQAPQLVEAQRAFWGRVNEEGGIGGAFEVNIDEYTRDNKYNPEVHNQVYEEIKPNILALAQSLGTPTTVAVLEDMKSNNIVAAPASWSSLWEYEDVILESGNSYCVESMNGLDWVTEQDAQPATVMAVFFPTDYGQDGAAGAKIWADTNGADFVPVQQIPLSQGGTTQASIDAVVQQNPDVVIITTGPIEMAEIVGNAVAQGFTGRFIGNGPTWNPGVLQGAAADALRSQLTVSGPTLPWGTDTPGHNAMREYLGDIEGNNNYTAGWQWSYPLRAVLEDAAENGDLTRQGVMDALSELTSVDYEGMLPDSAGNFSGEPAEQYTTSSAITVPSETDVQLVSDGFYEGPTVTGWTPPADQACYQATSLE